jgi:8-oxo-dGTP diphosphatase
MGYRDPLGKKSFCSAPPLYGAALRTRGFPEVVHDHAIIALLSLFRKNMFENRRKQASRASCCGSDSLSVGDKPQDPMERPMDDRLFPARPILAVSAAVFRKGRVLIVRRARAPLIGHFSLPGGVVELGETVIAAVARELEEEVGLAARIVGFNRHVEAIGREGDRVRTHFVIASFVARWISGEARMSDEVDRVDWIDPAADLPSPTTPGLSEILVSAARIESQTA